MEADRHSRIRQLIGNEALQRLRDARVLVVGLGAVGSYAVEGLARAGVGHLRLVDFDVVQTSNINRQLYALDSTIGRPKCDVARERVLDIQPDCEVETLRLFVHADSMNQLFEGFEPDFVLDAIDAMSPKVELICALRERGLDSLSSMGAALRTDPTQVKVGPLSEVRGCPLARQIKKHLNNRGVPKDMMCVYSTEDVSPIRTKLLGAPEEPKPEEFTRGRARHVLGSLPTLTGIFGLTMANYTILKLAGLKPAGLKPTEVKPTGGKRP